VLVWVYEAGTSTLATLYTDRTKATEQDNPLSTNGLGNLAIYSDPGDYEAHVDSTGAVLLFTVLPDWEDVVTGDEPEGGLPAHLADAVDAHDASAISVVPAGSLAATTVQAALAELDAEKEPVIAPGTYPLTAAVVLKSIVDAAGDLIVGTGADTVARLAPGTSLQVLRVNAGATALEWSAAPVTALTDLRGALVSTPIMSMGVTGDTQNRREIRANGEMYSGDGSVAPVLSLATRSGSTLLGRTAGLVDSGNTITAIGLNALKANTTGASNTAVGQDSLIGCTTGSTNSALGRDSLRSLTTGVANTGIGHQALYFNSTASQNTALGAFALANITTGASNVAVGHSALKGTYPSTATTCVAIGVNALFNASSGASACVAVGYEAMKMLSTGTNSVGVGANALNAMTTGANNVAVGSGALSALTTASGCVAVGTSQFNTTTGSWNCSIGHHALYNNTTGEQNAALGTNTMFNSTTGWWNTAAGNGALQGLTVGADNNVGVGFHSHYGPGNDVLANALTTGLRNTAIGTQTGQASATQRNDTVCVGFRALVDGDNAIAIGSGASAGAAGSVAIGKDSAGTGASTTTADKIKLGTALHTVDVIGNVMLGGAAKSVGFYGSAGVAKQTGVAVDAAGIHAALVALNLIAA
jgi:hypothetical protein